MPEIRTNSTVLVNVTIETLPILYKTSSFKRLVRIIAFCIRFIHNAKFPDNKFTGLLTPFELSKAEIAIIKQVQAESLANILDNLNKHKSIEKNCNLLSLNPFLDEYGIIRVGGRLSHSNLKYDHKHPIILPKHRITEIIIMEEHIRLLHSSQLLTLHSLREKYWPISGKRQVRKVLRTCLRCFKVNPVSNLQLMGNLPKDRVTAARPFIHCGVDYAGPLLLKEGSGRGKRTVKAYICLFICLATKAVHLELVGALSTDFFLNALKRFISRRGHVSDFYSDNGTNFVGAQRELSNLLKNTKFHDTIKLYCTELKINWHFIPPAAPHQGGLWESNIKLVKSQLKRTIGEAKLTFEEMYTLLTRIEACINSRPISPLSEDPQDLSPLTPSHFLIGDLLIAPIEVDVTNIKINRLSRWQYVEQLRQQFWNRWHRDYLNNLPQRSKWKKQSANIKIGDLVLVRNDTLPPLQWPLGRVHEVHPGADGVVRVVTVKTKNGLCKRPLNKICLLPTEYDNI